MYNLPVSWIVLLNFRWLSDNNIELKITDKFEYKIKSKSRHIWILIILSEKFHVINFWYIKIYIIYDKNLIFDELHTLQIEKEI